MGCLIPPLYYEIMTFQKIDFKRDLKLLTDIWNKEYNLIYPISYALMERNTENAYLDASFIVKENEEIAGFIISKIYDKMNSVKTEMSEFFAEEKKQIKIFSQIQW